MFRLFFCSCAVMWSFEAAATTVVQKSEEDFFREAQILCAVQLDGEQRSFLRGDQVFSQSSLKVLRCFKGELPPSARLEWIGGTAIKMHEHTQEKITTRVPGLNPPKAQEAFVCSFSLKENNIYLLEDWNHRLPLLQESAGEYFVQRIKESQNFISLQRPELNQNKALRSKKELISLDQLAEKIREIEKQD